MKTTLDLPDELVREMKLRAVSQGRTLRDLAADFIRQGLGMTAAKPAETPGPDSMVQIGTNGLPFFRCRPDAPASRMSLQELLDLEQQTQTEEDMLRAGLSH